MGPAHKAAALDAAAPAMVPMGENKAPGAVQAFFPNRIIRDKHGRIVGYTLPLGGTVQGLSLPPALLVVHIRPAQVARDLFVVHSARQQL